MFLVDFVVVVVDIKDIETTLNAVDQVLGNHDAALRQQIVIKNG